MNVMGLDHVIKHVKPSLKHALFYLQASQQDYVISIPQGINPNSHGRHITMNAKSKKTEVAATEVVAEAEVQTVEQVTITLPKGSKVTASKRTIIAPAHASTGNKERWFETKRLTNYSVKDGLISITLPKFALSYRQMLND